MSNFQDHALLVAARDVQRRSPNLVIYSRLVKGLIEVSWIIKPDGQPLKATGAKEWLRNRGLFLECLCPMVLDIQPREPRSCRLVESSSSGDVFAFCHLEVDGCGMHVNISNIVETTDRFSEYNHFPTLKGSTPDDCAAMRTILARYHDAGYPNNIVAPHLVGYIGEHIVFYEPGANQMAGAARLFGGMSAMLKFKSRTSASFRIDKPLSQLMSKRRYVEIDEFDNPSSNPPSAAEASTFMTPFKGKSRALTKKRRTRTTSLIAMGQGAVVAAPPAIAPAAPITIAGPIVVAGPSAPTGPAAISGPGAIAVPVAVAGPIAIAGSAAVAGPVTVAAPVVVAGAITVAAAATGNTVPIPTAGPSRLSPISISSDSDDDDEETDRIRKVFDRLLESDQGVGVREWFNLASLCTSCGMFFLSIKLAEHYEQCVTHDAALLVEED